MKIVRVVDRGDGMSVFEEVDIEMPDIRPDGILSKSIKANMVRFRKTSPNYEYSWHPTPLRQIVIVLEGAVEIEVGNGEKRIFHAGHLFLLEDTTGRGHIARAVGGQSRLSMNVELG